MKDLSGQRGWEYAYKKKLEDEIEVLRDALEITETEFPKGRSMEEYHFVSGKVRGLRIALKEMADAREKFKLDDDAD